MISDHVSEPSAHHRATPRLRRHREETAGQPHDQSSLRGIGPRSANTSTVHSAPRCRVDRDEAVVKWWRFGVLGDEILLLQGTAQCGDDLASFKIGTSVKRSISFVGRVTKPCTIMAPPRPAPTCEPVARPARFARFVPAVDPGACGLGCRARRSISGRHADRTHGGRYIWSHRRTSSVPLISSRTSSRVPSTSTISYKSRRRAGSARSHRTSRGCGFDQYNLAGRPTLPWSGPLSSSSARGTGTSRTRPGRLLPGAALPLILVMVPQTGATCCQHPFG